MSDLIRVFPESTKWTPTDDWAFVGDPPFWRPGTADTPVMVSVTFTWLRSSLSGVRRRRSIWTIAVTPYSGNHTSTFPLKIAEVCIDCGCPPGGTVLDPFCGRGTVGLVALRMGRNFIGIDADSATVEEGRQWIIQDAPLLNTSAEHRARA